MAWRDNLRPASFKGVPFHVEARRSPLGGAWRGMSTRSATRPTWKTWAAKPVSTKVDAFVVGPDYMDERDALLKALESEGAGQLVHPYYGTLQVVASGDSSITESSAQGGMARLSITFVEAGEQAPPSASADTSAVLQSRYSAARKTPLPQTLPATLASMGSPTLWSMTPCSASIRRWPLPGMGLGELDWIRANPDSTFDRLAAREFIGQHPGPAVFGAGPAGAGRLGCFGAGLGQLQPAHGRWHHGLAPRSTITATPWPG